MANALPLPFPLSLLGPAMTGAQHRGAAAAHTDLSEASDASQIKSEAASPASDSSRAAAPETLLLQRYATGDDAAMDELVTMYQDQAFWVARHLVRNDEMALDIIQDAFVRLIKKYDTYDYQRSSFRAWFLQIVRNMAIDHLRKARVRISTELAEVHPAEPRPDEVVQAELGERIRAIIDTLPDPYRELLIWRDVEGMSPQDIATMTETEYGTTRWRVHHARKLFRQEWTARYGDERP